MTAPEPSATSRFQPPGVGSFEMPAPHFPPMPEEASELRIIQRSKWETLVHLAGAIEPNDAEVSNWWILLAGISGTSLISFLAGIPTTNQNVLAGLAALTLLGAVSAGIVRHLEGRINGRRTRQLTVLHREMETAEKDMMTLGHYEKEMKNRRGTRGSPLAPTFPSPPGRSPT